MTWRTVGAAVAGQAHESSRQPGRHAFAVRHFPWAPGGPVVVLVAADGSAAVPRGGEGARLAVRAAVAHAEDALATGRWHGEETMRSCFAVARLQLMAEAATFGQPLSDLACTLLMAVLGRQMTLLGQIGDGAMVLASHHDETLYVPIRPQLGDGEGVTTRLTDEGAVGLLQIREFPEPARHAAVFTPGLRRLALRWGDEVGHKPFFQPFFDVLQTAEDGDQARLDDALATFLRSPTVRQRTEDDVTLLVASWTGFPPPILPGE